ncbi:hypothetical protein F5Y16DRAFT_390365 [Xylariaceae sp. FL0255]|nr:hypothetical protein F5Y16DRAFT_390365 [Xylariaceae sp. FL0255]
MPNTYELTRSDGGPKPGPDLDQYRPLLAALEIVVQPPKVVGAGLGNNGTGGVGLEFTYPMLISGAWPLKTKEPKDERDVDAKNARRAEIQLHRYCLGNSNVKIAIVPLDGRDPIEHHGVTMQLEWDGEQRVTSRIDPSTLDPMHEFKSGDQCRIAVLVGRSDKVNEIQPWKPSFNGQTRIYDPLNGSFLFWSDQFAVATYNFLTIPRDREQRAFLQRWVGKYCAGRGQPRGNDGDKWCDRYNVLHRLLESSGRG